jgi:hypothetical protein
VRNVPDKTQRFLLASLALWIQEQARASEYRTLEALMQLSIEHVLPQGSLKEEDAEAKAWRDSFGAPDAVAANGYVYMLGNLTLLPAEVNSMIGALPYATKAETFGGQPLLLTRTISKDIREGHATGRRELADRFNLRPYERWTATELGERHEWLLALIQERWSLLPPPPRPT